MLRRLYYLGNKQIDSSDCDGFLHKAKKDKPFLCVACGELIKKNQQYVRMSVFGSDDDLLHKDCYVGDHPDSCILGVKVEKIYDIYHILRTHVICEEFSGKQEKCSKELQ